MACQNADLDQKEMPGPEESSAITEQDDNKAGSLMKCARCTDREAVCFCIECGERYCKLHEEVSKCRDSKAIVLEMASATDHKYVPVILVGDVT